MKRKLRLASGSLLLLAAGVSYGQTYQPLAVSSGFNQDVIANGVGDASQSTTSDIDNSGYAFLSADFRATASSSAPSYSLPASGVITSLANSNVVFNLAPYNENNALKLVENAATGTLAFSDAISATNLYIIATSGSGDSSITLAINFTDGTSQTVNDSTIPDWYYSTSLPSAYQGTGRVSRFDNGMQGSSTDPRMYQLTLNVDVANQNKTIESITVTKNGSSGALNIFGVSAKVTSNCPEITSATAGTTGIGTANISWVLGSNGSGGSSTTYTVEVYTDAAYTTQIAGSPFTGITTTSQSLTGLANDTMYYYRVKANNGVCDSGYTTGSFFSGYCIPTGFTTSSSYYLTNVVTTGGSSNISNATGSNTTAYANFSSQAVSQIPGGSFNITLNVNSGTNYFYVWVDWNNDLDFSDEGETVVATTDYTNDYSGTINIPMTQAPGNYRMRVSSSYIGQISSACGPAAYGEFEDYTITVLTPPSCYFPTGLAANYGYTSSTFSWNTPTVGTTPEGFEYILTTTEGVPTESGTATADTSFTADTTIGTTYYLYVRTNCGSGDYSTWSSATFTPNYCTPTINSPNDDYITNVVTTGGYTNINNSTTSDSGYENYTTMAVSKAAGSSFEISVTRYAGYDSLGVYIDWNNNLNFDDEGETLVNIEGSWGDDATHTATIAIPANTPTGSYRLRVRSAYYYGNTMGPCNDFSYGETEDYTLNVAEQPANCETPGTPDVEAGNVTASNITVTVTPSDSSAPAPNGYILVRSTAVLTAAPVIGTAYPVGATLGGGTVVASSATAPSFTDFVSANTHYYYTSFAYNDGGISCFGPVYSEGGVSGATTCATATANSGASNIGNYGATLNWTSVDGPGGAETTYTVEVYSDAELTTLVTTQTTTTNSYVISNLEIGATYYYKVKASTGSCNNDTWTEALSFTTQSNYTPLTVTGFNADVIANGTGIANVSTTAGVDGANNAYMAMNYRNSATGSTTSVGLPVNRRLPNSGVAGLEFLLADYSGNNSLRLAAQGQEGTLTLTNPVKANNLYFAVTSGSGYSNIDVTVNFADGTTQVEPAISVTDWFDPGTTIQPALISNIGRANRANAIGGPETGNSKVFYITLPISTDNQFKTINSITISKSSDGDTEPVPNIFAVSAQLVNECPVLNSAFTFPSETTASVTFGLLAGSAEADSYSYALYTDEAMTIPVEGSPFTSNSTSLALSSLTGDTTYYYSATAINEMCTSAAVTGSFTTSAVSGTDSFGKNGFVVFPNPANTLINVQAGASISQLTLVNLLGQTVLTQSANGTQAQLNLAGVAAGTYILQVTSGDRTSAVKVIKN